MVPGEVIDRLAGNEVVLLGEIHHLREHWVFVADLIGGLHERGFRLLLEAPPCLQALHKGCALSGSPRINR